MAGEPTSRWSRTGRRILIEPKPRPRKLLDPAKHKVRIVEVGDEALPDHRPACSCGWAGIRTPYRPSAEREADRHLHGESVSDHREELAAELAGRT